MNMKKLINNQDFWIVALFLSGIGVGVILGYVLGVAQFV